MMFKEGTSAFIVESNRLIREVTIKRRMGDFYIVKFVDSNGGIQLRSNRLFATREDAEKTIPNVKGTKRRYLSPYEYLH